MIPLLDLKKQYHSIKEEIAASLHKLLESGKFILGDEGKGLEKEIAEFSETKSGIGVASGSDALEIALKALGIAEGDEVITSPFTFIATAEAIVEAGAKIVFADIDPETYNLDPSQITQRITPKTKAIIPVHLYGQPCNMDAIMSLAKTKGFYVVEDCAQALGAEYKGKKVGSFGDAGCLSFFPSKNLGGYGDGGMIVTNNQEVSDKARILRVHGSKDKYFHILKGRNSRLDEIQALVLRIKLKYLAKWNEVRRQRAGEYTELFTKNALTEKIKVPKTTIEEKHVFGLYTVRTKERKALIGFLKSKNISTAVHYPLPLHLQEVYKEIGYKAGDFPNAEAASKEVMSLPLYPEMSTDEVYSVVRAIKEFYDCKA